MGFIREVEGTNSHYAFVFRIHAIGIARIAVSDAMTIVSAESYAQARNSVVIQTKRYAILIGNVELQWRLMAFLYPADIGEVVGIQTCHELRLVSEVFISAPQRYTRLVPRTGHDSTLTLRTIDGEETQRFVMGVSQADRHHDMSSADVDGTRERFLNPELLQLYLTTFLGLLFPFSAFFVFLLVSNAVSSVLELNLGTERPALAEVVT